MHAGRKLSGGAMLVTVAFVALAFAPTAGAAPLAPAMTFSFPSANSQIVGSVGFVNGCEAGYFWSASRGDSVSQSLRGGKRINHAILDVSVVENALSNGAEVDWSLSINGHTVDSFAVTEGFLGDVHRDVTFPKIRGRNYAVKLFVTNEVPGGDGSITLAYADCGGSHTLVLKKG
jgi:hypothetical protein